MSWVRAIAGLLLLILVLSAPARADELRPGYLELTQKSASHWSMVWKAPIKGGLATHAQPILPKFCTVSEPRRELVEAAVVSKSEVRCTAPLAKQALGLDGLDASFTDALVRIAPLGQPVQAARLTPNSPTVLMETRADSTQVAKTYFLLGVEHILTGYDHFLFVLSLVLLLVGGRTIAKTVTAFTVAHSLTLIGTTLHLISVPRQPVEICIALSIVFLAVEIVKAKPSAPRLSERFPWLVAFAFGLLHGFGFAGALAEIGLPEGDVPVALLTFNLGVELGQLIIVAGGLAVLAVIRHFAEPLIRSARVVAAYAIGSIAAFWMIERAIA
jgi:hydrogenase/urease accessory protein HupE